MILVSACLYGMPCRYDGGNCACDRLDQYLSGEALLVLCPEQLGGLATPRPAAELCGGDGADVLAGKAKVVLSCSGEDVTESFVAGARRAAALASACGVTHAILKARSPSCSVSWHYESEILVTGMGVTAAALLEAGVMVEEWG